MASATARTRAASADRVVAELELPGPVAAGGGQLDLGQHLVDIAQADRLEAGHRDLLDPAEQRGDGPAEQLAAQIPQRDVDRGLAGEVADHEPVHAVDQHPGAKTSQASTQLASRRTVSWVEPGNPSR